MNENDLKKESETLFIPLLGKAKAAQYGDILHDPKAKEMVTSLQYNFGKHKQSRFLSIYMGIRAAILDEYAESYIKEHPDCVVIHLGCGLDSRVCRVKRQPYRWIDLDLPDVISVRKKFFSENEHYTMIGKSVTDLTWLDSVNAADRPVLVIAEGLTMYLTDQENKRLFASFLHTFQESDYIFDAYSISAVQWSKRKNPVNKMGATIRWGLDEPKEITKLYEGVSHLETKYFTEEKWSNKLTGFTKLLFKLLYGNAWANSLYRIYRFRLKRG